VRVEVALTPAAVEASTRRLAEAAPDGPGGASEARARDVAVVVDVIRATTSAAHAMAAGCRELLALAGLEQARQAAAARGALLAGERGALRPEGFDLGNSPAAFTRERCAGRPLVLCTTNGTRAIAALPDGVPVLLGALVNAEAVVRRLEALAPARVLVVCAGTGGAVAADDVAGAGCLVGNLLLRAGAEPLDGARVALGTFDAWRHDLLGLLRRSAAGRKLARVDLLDDLDACVRVDAVPVVPEREPGRDVFGVH